MRNKNKKIKKTFFIFLRGFQLPENTLRTEGGPRIYPLVLFIDFDTLSAWFIILTHLPRTFIITYSLFQVNKHIFLHQKNNVLRFNKYNRLPMTPGSIGVNYAITLSYLYQEQILTLPKI